MISSCTDIELAFEVISEVNEQQLDPVMAIPINAYMYEKGALKLIV